MTTFRSNMPDLLQEGLRAVAFQKYKQYPQKFETIFNVLTSKKATETDSGIIGLGNMVLKPEGEKVFFDDPKQAYDVTYTHITMALGFRITTEMWEDELYNKIQKMPKALARSAAYAPEQYAANILNNGFVTTYNTGGDGVALFSTAHPRADGSSTTQANTPNAAADLTTASLQAAINTIANWTDDRGFPIHLTPIRLIHPQALRWTVSELLKSDKNPENAENAINTIKEDSGLKAFEWIQLTDPDTWFIQCDTHDLNFFWRQKLKTESDTDFDTGDLKFKATMRYSAKWSDWRGIYGCPGA